MIRVDSRQNEIRFFHGVVRLLSLKEDTSMDMWSSTRESPQRWFLGQSICSTRRVFLLVGMELVLKDI